MGLSSDEGARARQLANLPNLRGEATSTAWQPGDAPHLQHGERTRRPQASPEWSPAVSLAILDLEGRVSMSLRDDRGELLPMAVPSVEAVAIQRVACVRMDRYVAGREAKGSLTAEDLDKQSRVGARYHAALEREAMTLRSNLEARVVAVDLASAMSERDPERHAEMMRAAGVPIDAPIDREEHDG